MKCPKKMRPHRPFLFTLGSPAIRWASLVLAQLANVRFRLIPKLRVSVPERNPRLVLLGIVLFQPEQLVDRVHRLLHHALHLGLRDV